MWIRSAYWTGKPVNGDAVALKQFVCDKLLPELATLPGVIRAQAFWPERHEDGSPDIVCQIALSFNSREDIDAMLASPQRNEVRERAFASLKDLFEGTLAHIDFEVFSVEGA